MLERRHLATLFVAASVGAGCTADTEPSYFLFDQLSHREIPVPAASEPYPGKTAWFAGPEIPLDDVGRIAFVRLWGDTLVGVFDSFACQAHLMRMSGDAVETVVRLGRCGDGPGELRGALDMHLDGDTLIVVDDRNALTFFSTSDEGARTLQLGPQEEDGWRAAGVLLASKEDLWLSGTLAMGSRGGYGLLRRLARSDGRRLADEVSEAEAPRANVAPLLHQSFACADAEAERIVVGNRWRVERAVLTPDFEFAADPYRSSVDWVRESPFPDGPGVRPDAFVRLACGQGRALVLWRTLADRDTIDRFYLEVLEFEGGIVHQEHGRGPGQDHPAGRSVAGALGDDGWLTYTNQSDLGPVLQVFRLR